MSKYNIGDILIVSSGYIIKILDNSNFIYSYRYIFGDINRHRIFEIDHYNLENREYLVRVDKEIAEVLYG
jgi:hypothetical protein